MGSREPRVETLVGDAAAWAGMVDPYGSTAVAQVVPPIAGACVALAWILLVASALLWRIRRMDLHE